MSESDIVQDVIVQFLAPDTKKHSLPSFMMVMSKTQDFVLVLDNPNRFENSWSYCIHVSTINSVICHRAPFLIEFLQYYSTHLSVETHLNYEFLYLYLCLYHLVSLCMRFC